MTRVILWLLACAGTVVAYVTLTRRSPVHHLVGACVIGCLFWLALAVNASASPFDPPKVQRAVNAIGDAYDDYLRPRYGVRAGITTRCRGRSTRIMFCTVHVRKNGHHVAWLWTRVDLHKGNVRTVCGYRLYCNIAVPRPGRDVLYYESRPTR